jgi:nicotinamide mononucleotide transporter
MTIVDTGSLTQRTFSFIPRREQGTRINLIQGTVIGLVLTALSYFVALSAGWITEFSPLEAFAVFTSYVCTFLCVMERRINYPIGAASCFAYTILFYQFGLYGSATINAYLTIALVYGWFRWKSDTDSRPVSRVQWKWVPVYVAVTAAFYYVALTLITAVGGTLAVTDTVILIGSMLAQFLLDNKKIETWVVWMVVNVFAIYVYATSGLPLAAFQYVFFFLNAFYGLYVWNKSMKVTA